MCQSQVSAMSESEAPPASPPPRSGVLTRFLRSSEASVTLATLGLILVIGAMHPQLLQPAQLLNLVSQTVFVAVLAAGATFLLAMREIDLSLESTFALTLVAAALLMKSGMDPWLAALLGLMLGLLLGWVNGVVVETFKIPSLIATLATLSLFRGLVFAISGGQQVTGLPLDHPFFTALGGSVFGFPVPVLILLVVVTVLTLLVARTPFGYRVRQIGSNPAAAAFSGIPVAQVRFAAFMLAGLLAGVAGLLGLSYFTSADPNIGAGYSLSAIAAVVIGGTPLRGGSATILGSVIGALLLTVVTSGLVYFNVPANWSQFATGAVILVAVSLDSIMRRRSRSASSES